MSSRTRLSRDPAELAERAEQLRHFEIAQQIRKLPEPLWEGKVALLPGDRRAEVRRCLELIKQHAPRKDFAPSEAAEYGAERACNSARRRDRCPP